MQMVNLYYILGTVSAKLQPIINGYEIGARLNKIVLSNLEFDSKDIK
jgi:hypothetical protein